MLIAKEVLMAIVLAVASIAIILVLFIAQRKQDSFDLRWLILDERTAKPSIHKIGQGAALVITSWGFVYQILHNALSDLYLIVYMSWAGIEVINKMIVSRTGTSASSTSTSTTVVETVDTASTTPGPAPTPTPAPTDTEGKPK